MIDYALYCRIKQLDEQGHSSVQIGAMLDINEKTVRKWLGAKKFTQRRESPGTSKLDAFKPQIAQWLGQADFTAVQIYQKLGKVGYKGGRSILGDYLRSIRPRHRRAYQTLHFAPGEAAQVDWGSCQGLQIGGTRRRLSFLCVVLCHSRQLFCELIEQYRRSRADSERLAFEDIDPIAPIWLTNLGQHHPNSLHHIRQILRLTDLHGSPAVAHALRQSHDFGIYTWHTVQNLLDRQLRGHLPLLEPMAPTASSRPLLELRLPCPDLSLYPGNPPPSNP